MHSQPPNDIYTALHRSRMYHLHRLGLHGCGISQKGLAESGLRTGLFIKLPKDDTLLHIQEAYSVAADVPEIQL